MSEEEYYEEERRRRSAEAAHTETKIPWWKKRKMQREFERQPTQEEREIRSEIQAARVARQKPIVTPRVKAAAGYIPHRIGKRIERRREEKPTREQVVAARQRGQIKLIEAQYAAKAARIKGPVRRPGYYYGPRGRRRGYAPRSRVSPRPPSEIIGGGPPRGAPRAGAAMGGSGVREVGGYYRWDPQSGRQIWVRGYVRRHVGGPVMQQPTMPAQPQPQPQQMVVQAPSGPRHFMEEADDIFGEMERGRGSGGGGMGASVFGDTPSSLPMPGSRHFMEEADDIARMI